MYGGHAKTIKPDKRRLALLFDNPNIRYNFCIIIISIFIDKFSSLLSGNPLLCVVLNRVEYCPQHISISPSGHV